MVAAAGMVNIQAVTMLPATPQRTALRRLVAPTPMMEAAMTCVVLTGMPNFMAPTISTSEAEDSAAKPWMGCSLMILEPMVLMIRQPPDAVPMDMAAAQHMMTHSGGRRSAPGTSMDGAQ